MALPGAPWQAWYIGRPMMNNCTSTGSSVKWVVSWTNTSDTTYPVIQIPPRYRATSAKVGDDEKIKRIGLINSMNVLSRLWWVVFSMNGM